MVSTQNFWIDDTSVLITMPCIENDWKRNKIWTSNNYLVARDFIILIWFVHVINGLRERIRKVGCMLLAWLFSLLLLVFLVSFSSLIIYTTLLSNYPDAKWFIEGSSVTLPLSFSFPHPARKTSKDSSPRRLLRDCHAETPTTPKAYHSLLISFSLSVFHTWWLFNLYLDNEQFSHTSEYCH